MFNLIPQNVQSASKIENIPQKEKVSGKQFFLFAAALGLHYLCTMNYLEVFGALVGLIYLWLEYRASIYLWLACIVMPAIYLVVYYQAVCRFRNQRVLPAGFGVWLDSLE